VQTFREWLDYRRQRRADHRALRKERAQRRREGGGDATEIGYAGVGKGNKSKRHAGTPGGG
jgi:hypothetical protein